MLLTMARIHEHWWLHNNNFGCGRGQVLAFYSDSEVFKAWQEQN